MAYSQIISCSDVAGVNCWSQQRNVISGRNGVCTELKAAAHKYSMIDADYCILKYSAGDEKHVSTLVDRMQCDTHCEASAGAPQVRVDLNVNVIPMLKRKRGSASASLSRIVS